MSETSRPSSASDQPAHPRLPVRTTILLVVFMIAILFAMGSQEKGNIGNVLQASTMPAATQTMTATATISPETIAKDPELTTGLILGAILLLLIIIVGTLAVIGHKV